MKKIKVTIAIPSYNNEKTISETIKSAFYQDYPLKEVLVIDDCSTDRTVDKANLYSCRVIKNEKNLGIIKNIEKLMKEARGKYIIYLCADDVFTNSQVVSDVVRIFDRNHNIGIIGRFFYFFLDKHPGAIGVCRDRNILTSSCCPSGMAFRRDPDVQGLNKIFIEMPSIVVEYLKKGWEWTMIEYDTFAARFHPGGNTGTKTSYYKESPLKNWVELTGDKTFQFHEGFIQLKNRAPHLLIPEIILAIKYNWKVLLQLRFWIFAGAAVILPRRFLLWLTPIYRDKITRRHVKTIQREEWLLGNVVKEKYTKKGIF